MRGLREHRTSNLIAFVQNKTRQIASSENYIDIEINFYEESRTQKGQATSKTNTTQGSASGALAAHKGLGRPRKRAAETDEENTIMAQTAEKKDLRN